MFSQYSQKMAVAPARVMALAQTTNAGAYIVRVSNIAATAKIVTLEGLGTPEKPHPVQQAFIEEQAAQCGYCINGMVMQTAAFLAARPGNPSEREIRGALQANLCRCGTHQRIIAAVKRAAALMGKGA